MKRGWLPLSRHLVAEISGDDDMPRFGSSLAEIDIMLNKPLKTLRMRYLLHYAQ